MEGKKEKSQTEKTQERPIRTDLVHDIENNNDNKIYCKGENSCSATDNGKILETIFNNIELCKERWPMKMLTAVLQRYKRMPRMGWNLAHKKFCTLFQTSISELEFKKKATSAIVSDSGKRCSLKKYERDPAKRTKTIDSLFEEKTLLESKYYIQVKEKFKCLINDIKIKTIDTFPRTRKIPSEKLNNVLINNVDNAVKEYIITNRPKNMTDIAKILQASQMTYQEISSKEKKPSEWKENIEAKILKYKIHLDLLKKSKDINSLNLNEQKALKKLMRENNLIMNKETDIKICTDRMLESQFIYQKKLDMYEKRKLFRKENQYFELSRVD